jgi:CHRD domain
MSQTFARQTRRSILSYCLGGAGAALLAMTSRSQAAPATFTADLKGSSEVPSNTTAGTGSATVTFDAATNKITWNVSFSGLTGPATAVHIHGPAPVGKNAGVLIWLSTKGKTATSPLSGTATFPAADASDLMNGQCYVNVHTTANPGGEIRGQLVKS